MGALETARHKLVNRAIASPSSAAAPIHCVAPVRLQPSSTRVSSPKDPAEKEAEATARNILRMPAPALHGWDSPYVARHSYAIACLRAHAPPRLLARHGEDQPVVTPAVSTEIANSQGAGQPLPSTVRSYMEPRFKADFGAVRVHIGERAAWLNRQVQAQAFTVGNQIFFGRGRFQPETDAGKHLIAHELAHTIQQGAAMQAPAVERSEDACVDQHMSPHVVLAAAAAPSSAPAFPSADELTTRISKAIGVWETNRGGTEPKVAESSLTTVANTRASMATIEQATIGYALQALREHPSLRNKASPEPTAKEINDAIAVCKAVDTLLDDVMLAANKGTKPDDFIKDHGSDISNSKLSEDNVRTMFKAVVLKATIDAGNAQLKAKEEKDRKTSKEVVDAIPKDERLGLSPGSLRAYVEKPGKWGENRVAWQRLAVNNMSGDLGKRINTAATSDGGMALIIPVVRKRVGVELAKDPRPTEEQIVKAVGKQNNAGEKNYGDNIWKTYQQLAKNP